MIVIPQKQKTIQENKEQLQAEVMEMNGGSVDYTA